MLSAKETEYTIDDIQTLPEGVRAELIDGHIYMMAAPTAVHQRMIGEAYFRIRSYIAEKGGPCETIPSPFAVYLNEERDYYEPDLVVICDPSKIQENGCHGAPDWVMEVVSPSSRGMDYMIKMGKYQTAGVREYWVVDPDRNRVTVYGFEVGEVTEYSLKEAVPVGIYEDLTIVFDEA